MINERMLEFLCLSEALNHHLHEIYDEGKIARRHQELMRELLEPYVISKA